MDLHEKPSGELSSPGDQTQLEETASKDQSVGEIDEGVPGVATEDQTAATQMVSGEHQDSSSRGAEHAEPPIGKSEQPEAATDGAHRDEANSDQKDLTRDETTTRSPDVKSRELDGGDAQEHAQEHSQGDKGVGSMTTHSPSQDQALGAESQGTESDYQEALATGEGPGSHDKLTASGAQSTERPAHEEEPDQGLSQPTADGPTSSDNPAGQEPPQSSVNEDSFRGVAKGGAAEEYVRMAEAESGQEPQLGGDKPSIPEQGSLSGSSQPPEQPNGISNRDIGSPEPAQLDTSTSDQDIPEHTGQAQADERPSFASEQADPAEHKAQPPVESEQEGDQLQSRDIGSSAHGGSHDESTVNPEQGLRSSAEQPELGQSQDLGSLPSGQSKDDKPSAASQDSPDVDSSHGERLQESELAEHLQSGNTSTDPISQPRDLDLPEAPRDTTGISGVDEVSTSEKDTSGAKLAEHQQGTHDNEQQERPPESDRGEQEQLGHGATPQPESDSIGQQGPSSPDPSAPRTPSHLGKDPGDNQENGSVGRHGEVGESRDAPQTSLDDSVSGDGDVPRQSSRGTPNVMEPSNVEALPHESGIEQELGDKRSDSGYETGMASSRNLEDSSTTLHEDQHEHHDQSVQDAGQSLASAPSERELETPREPRPEQILEGSGKGVSPPRLGGEHQGSDDLPVDETFDLSGSEPIPGTMTHGKDETEDRPGTPTGGDVSSQDVSHQPPAEDAAAGAAADGNQRGEVVDETRGEKDLEDSVSRESPQEADNDHTQTGPQPMAHDAGDTLPADSRSQVAEKQLQQGGPPGVAESLGQGPSGERENSSRGSTGVDTQDQESTSNGSQADQPDPVDDGKSTNDRGLDEPRQGNDGAGVPASQEHTSQPSHASESPSSYDLDSNRFGSWGGEAHSRPADENEFSFKKRADSVQVGRSHGPVDRGADLPFISTDGPNEDADEGLFAVPPTPRHEVDHDKPLQLQEADESTPSSRASSRKGSTRADTLSPKAAEGPGGSSREGSDRELPLEASETKEDSHHESIHSPGDGQQAHPNVLETPDSPREKTAGSEVDLDEPSHQGELERGQPEEPSAAGTESLTHETPVGDNDEQQSRKHSVTSPMSPREQRSENERHLDESVRPETPSLDQHSSGTPSKTDASEDHSREMEVGSDNQSRGTSGEHDAKTHELEKEHDIRQEGLASNNVGDQTLESSGDSSQRGGAKGGFGTQEMDTQPNSQIERDGSGSGNRSLGENDQAQHDEVPGALTSEDRSLRPVSPEGERPASDQDINKQISDLPQMDQGVGHGSEGDQVEEDHADSDRATHESSLDHSSQHLVAQQANYDGEGYGVTPSSEYSNNPLGDPQPREESETHPADDPIDTRRSEIQVYDLPDSTRSTRDNDPIDSGSETFETPLESADFRKSHQDDRSVTPGHFTQALDHLPDESAHTVQGTDDLFDDTDDGEDQDDYGEAVVYQHSNEALESSPGAEKTVYSTRGDENNTALGGHRSSLSLGSVGHRSQGSIGSMRDTTPVRPTFGSYIGGPSIVRADWAAEHEDELRPPTLNPTPQLGPSTTHDTPEISPFALRNTPMPSNGGDQRGLSSSMWNPERPQTPPSAAPHSNNPFATPQRLAEPEIDPSLFVPRDVTHGRQDSVPASLHSQTTLDSSWSSPVHSSLAVDRHEPVIRDSWPAPAPGYQQHLSGWSSRPRGDTTSTAAEYDPFRPDNGGTPGGHNAGKPVSSYNPFLQRGRAESSASAAPSNPSVSNSPSRGSALFAKMRNIFESQGSGAGNDVPASPGKTRPVSGVFHPAVSAPRKSQDSLTGQRNDERGGFLNEADHEIDERSAFLRSDGQPSGHMAYNDEH